MTLRDEFNNLVLAEMEAVYRLAYHLARNSAEAEDLTQETYLRAFKSAASFRQNVHGVRPWLFKILHNVLNTRLTREQRQREIVDELQHAPPAESSESSRLVPTLANIDWEKMDQRLKAAVAELPVAHRSVFLLCAVEDLGYREIAEIVDVPVGTVMSRLFRARAMLAARLTDLANEHGIGRKKSGPPDEMNSTL